MSELLPTFFWLGAAGQPKLEWYRVAGLVAEVQPDGTLMTKYREWMKVDAATRNLFTCENRRTMK